MASDLPVPEATREMVDERAIDDAREVAKRTMAPDFSRLGKRQIEDLCNIAFGGDGSGIPPSRLKKLAQKGLISAEVKTGGDRFGSYAWPVWFMPTPVHMAFCSFCETLEPVEADRG